MRVTHLLRFLPAGLLISVACSAPEAQTNPQKATQVVVSPPTFPHFERVIELETVAATSANVSIGDVNGDGNLDLVLAKGRHWPLVDRVLLGDGHGQTTAAYDLGTASDRTYSGLLVDLDGDRDLDVVISNDDPDRKLVYLNDGKGHFSVASTFGRPEWETRNASVADVNGDGQPDIIVANRTSRGAPANYVCLNRGQGRFDANCQAFSHEPATTITAADFDRDGKIDVAVPHRDRGQSYVYMNRGQTLFPESARVAFGPPDATIRMTEAVDVDRDGFLDLVAIDENRGVGVYFGQKDGTFSPIVEIADGKVAPYALATSDLNGDGPIDIIVGHIEAPSTIYFNDGSGRHYSPVSFGDAKGTIYGFAIADLDKDGALDIAAARSEATNVVYFGSPRPLHGQVVLPPTSEELERRDQPVTKEDLLILQRAAQLLESDAAWNRKDDRECEDDERSGKRSLFCALQKACIDVLGKYDHRRAALQEVRFAVEDATRGQDFEHRLRDFNNLPQTTLTDVRRVLQVATAQVQSRLKIK
jgi:hypothetical protein